MVDKVIVKEQKNNLIISTPGPQGPRGRTILNGTGNPANNLGLTGDFYYDVTLNRFIGPKTNDSSWADAKVIILTNSTLTTSWELAQIQGPTDGVYSVEIVHNLGYNPNVTVKSSAGDILEVGIDYNSFNKITLTMAQPFSGTAHLS